MKKIIVTTGDLDRPYEVLGPIYFQVSNKGLLGSSLDRLKRLYIDEIQRMKTQGTMSHGQADWGFLYGEYSVGQNDFEAAFFIATEELKKRAKRVGADAVICMRQDIDMDTNGFAHFYLQMYGTAVKFLDKEETPATRYNKAEDLMVVGRYDEAEEMYYRLGDFRDSKLRMRDAYEALCTAEYAKAEDMMAKGFYVEAERLFGELRNYKDAKARAQQAREEEEKKLAAQKTAGQNVDNKGWTCPGCGKQNPFFVRKCSCGIEKQAE